MRIAAVAFVCLAAIGTWPAWAAADVRVSFADPERYTDASIRGDHRIGPDAPALQVIRGHLRRLGERYLRPDDVLSIEILDIDLAGRYEPWRFPGQDLRYMREVTWPTIKVRYTLLRQGSAALDGEEVVTDQNYLMRAGARHSGTPLFYEKAMLDDWFRDRFGGTRGTPGR